MELTTGCIGSLKFSVKDIKHVQNIIPIYMYTIFQIIFKFKFMLKKRYTQED